MSIDKVVRKLARMRYDFRKYYPLESDGPCNGPSGFYDSNGMFIHDPNRGSWLFDPNIKPICTLPYRQYKGNKTTYKRKSSS